MKKFLLGLGVLLLLLFVYAFQIEPRLVAVHRLEFGKPPAAVKVVQLSDIQVSESYRAGRLKKIIRKANREQPDVIVFTGDLFDNYTKYAHTAEITAELKQLHASLGKYAVWGNHDYGGGAARVYQTVMNDADFTVLRNTGTTLTLKTGKRLFIGGLDDSLLGQPSVTQTLAYRSRADYSILLTHEPDVADRFLGTNTQLVLAGHSHGGQVRLPFYQVTNVLARKYVRGLYELKDKTKVYVNTGLGTTTIHARFGVIPEISVFKIAF
ncbi:metallophosphoesterase [Enterococcus sp. CSURQ0835]|uniref:metallophosphoesterase n=1 Tax=Enterococcus sp. CSURQ0835 TaxID=2681394 RepID=UPI0013577D72|nr:metallophosphoesterase [Enterococcus sp. CSURQ0835]